MTASTVVIGNLIYLIGAVVLAVIGGLIVVRRYRKPTSVEDNMAIFNRGLRALAPDAADGKPAAARRTAAPASRPEPTERIKILGERRGAHLAPSGSDTEAEAG